MVEYNRKIGEPRCGSPILLQKILREEWSFEDSVVSNRDDIEDIYERHKVASSPEEAAAMALKNGCDLCCGSIFNTLLKALDQGLITEKDIDISVKRLFMARFKLGMFDPE